MMGKKAWKDRLKLYQVLHIRASLNFAGCLRREPIGV